MTDMEMFNAYKENAFTTNFIVGGVCGKAVKFDFFTMDDLVNHVNSTIGSPSGEQGFKTLRLKFSKDLKKAVSTRGIELDCTPEKFEELAYQFGGNGKANRGKALEYLIHKHYGLSYKPDNRKFTESGDIVINGISYQIKGHKGTFSNEKMLTELSVRG